MMRCQLAYCMGHATVDDILVGGSVFDGMIERVIITRGQGVSGRYLIKRGSGTNLIDRENMPLSTRIEFVHADSNSIMMVTSTSGFSTITQDQTSMPDVIAEGVEISNGRATK